MPPLSDSSYPETSALSGSPLRSSIHAWTLSRVWSFLSIPSTGIKSKKYKADVEIEGKTYKGRQVTVPREGKKPLVATWGGIPLIWNVNTPIEDQIEQHH